MKFKDRVAIITGAAKGIGRATALELAGQGARVVVSDLDAAGGQAVVKEIEGLKSKALFVKADVARRADVFGLVDAAVKEFGRLDMLVNNAGICPINKNENITEEEWDLVLDINLKGVFFGCQAAARILKERRQGAIVNIASVAGKTGGAAVGAHYAASKAGVISLTKSYAKDMAPFGVRVNAIAPGPVDSPMTQAMPKEARDKMCSIIALGRMMEPVDIAKAAAFLLSDDARNITGEIMDVNGGAWMD